MALKEIMELVGPWARETFPAATPVSTAAHLVDEAQEVLSAAHELRRPRIVPSISDSQRRALLAEELADVVLLCASLAHMLDMDVDRAIRLKHDVNTRSTWSMSSRGYQKRDKTLAPLAIELDHYDDEPPAARDLEDNLRKTDGPLALAALWPIVDAVRDGQPRISDSIYVAPMLTALFQAGYRITGVAPVVLPLGNIPGWRWTATAANGSEQSVESPDLFGALRDLCLVIRSDNHVALRELLEQQIEAMERNPGAFPKGTLVEYQAKLKASFGVPGIDDD